jgi:hypothetical protein
MQAIWGRTVSEDGQILLFPNYQQLAEMASVELPNSDQVG